MSQDPNQPENPDEPDKTDDGVTIAKTPDLNQPAQQQAEVIPGMPDYGLGTDVQSNDGAMETEATGGGTKQEQQQRKADTSS